MSDKAKLLGHVVTLLQAAGRASEAAGYVSGVLATMEARGETVVSPATWAEIDSRIAAVKGRLDDKIASLPT